MEQSESESLKLARGFLGKEVNIKIDRQLGSSHPKHGFTYPVNYGYVEGITAPDGEDLDAYLLNTDKSVQEASGKCIAIVHRLNDDDDKLVVIPTGTSELTDEEIEKAVHFQEQWFQSIIVRK